MRKRNAPKVGAAEEAKASPPSLQSPEGADDFTLIRRFLSSSDPKTFRDLVERHLPSIRRLLYTLFNGQREDMEDAEQEIILTLFQGLKGFQFRSSFRTYLYRLARNRGIDCLRRRRSRQRALARLRPDLTDKEAMSPEEQVLRREEIGTLLSVFQTLPSKDRQLIVMKDVEDFSIDEIAEILEVPSGTVKSRLHRTRKKLAGFMRGGTLRGGK
ncbi:MAG: sigma-70 family RNA polymerase sigma factor [Spirochaetaceae bacterium]|nr:MAG: sigma-70 family RNA polymerase sigma factor [Spirochaetaceae bacterium]